MQQRRTIGMRAHGTLNAKPRGFTLVELLIVVVIIAILAAITIVAYNGIQARARDSARLQAVQTIAKALEMYYVDNGQYPPSGCTTGCKINNSWSTTSDGSWSVLQAALVPKYLSALPVDPEASTATNPAIYGGYNFDYTRAGNWCNTTTVGQLYMLAYKRESGAQTYDVPSDCTGTQPTNYAPSSEYVRFH